ncbi:hypothetical protein [Dactylosporangium sp. NPDC005555]|uniref:effector-associated domain 2-containing protein n=1 Tax=Dactylosporangium sp. NPDC005555 TaxID=3154889 RepID=UPI0033A31DDB
MTINDGRATDPLDAILGVPAATELRAWAHRTGRTIEAAEPFWQTSGFTAARLISVTVTHRGFPPRRPVKAILKWLPAGNATAEARLHAAALHDAPAAFRDTHMVELTDAGVFETPNGGVGLLQHIAGGSLDHVRPARDLSDAAMPAACALIIGKILTEWAAPARHEHANVSVLDFLNLEIDESAIGADAIGAGRLAIPRSAWLSIDEDGIVANPMPTASAGLATKRMTYLAGPSHGDLHTGNILVPQNGTTAAPQLFRVIDYADYRPVAPLSRDPATLLMSALTPWITRSGAEQQHWIVRYLITPSNTARAHLPPLVSDLIDSVRTAASAPFATDGWHDSWNDQFQLSLTAAALLHSGLDNLPTATRWQCFRLAAGLLTDFLHHRGAPIPDDARGIPTIDANVITAAHPITSTPPRRLDHGPPTRLSVRAIGAIADALLDYPEMLNDNARHQLISQLPPDIRGSVQYSATPRLHVVNLIRACADHPDGRGLLLDIIELASGPEARHNRLRERVDQWWTP